MYLMAQSCLHVVINLPRPPKPDQNMQSFPFPTSHYRILKKFCRNVEIPQKQANSAARFKILHTAENCGPYCSPEEPEELVSNLLISNSSL